MSSCCRKEPLKDEGIVSAVNTAYSKKAREGSDPSYANKVASAFGYTLEQLESIPSESHMGLSCGNPVAAASIKEGETVLDLGSGGGIDVFLAAAKVGPKGQVVGLDMSDDMIALARRNAATKGLKPPHVAFVKAALTEELPIESNSVDCVLSNCVINLLPPAGKSSLIREVYRVLKPGGRVALDDIIAKKTMPDSLRSNVAAYVGCISGAIVLEEYRTLLRDAGFSDKDIVFTENPSDLNVYIQGGCCALASSTSPPLDIGDLNVWASSYQIYATKSESANTGNSVTGSALKNWWDACPAPMSSPDRVQCEQVADLIRNSDMKVRKDFVVVDVRRNDHAGGHVRGSVQQPAQMFYDDLPEFYKEHKDRKQVIFYCGSSNGRGPRCAGWYQDYLDRQGNTQSKALVMTGGIKQWLTVYKDQEDLVDFD